MIEKDNEASMYRNGVGMKKGTYNSRLATKTRAAIVICALGAERTGGHTKRQMMEPVLEFPEQDCQATAFDFLGDVLVALLEVLPAERIDHLLTGLDERLSFDQDVTIRNGTLIVDEKEKVKNHRVSIELISIEENDDLPINEPLIVLLKDPWMHKEEVSSVIYDGTKVVHTRRPNDDRLVPRHFIKAWNRLPLFID